MDASRAGAGGGSCQVQLGNIALPAIQPAESHHVTAEAAFRPQQAPSVGASKIEKAMPTRPIAK